MRKVEVIPVIKEALEIVKKRFEKRIKKLNLDLTIKSLQKPCLPGTTRKIRKTLDMKR